MARPIRVTLVNDYMIVLEGLRSLLRSSEPEIEVVELDVRKRPKRDVDVTLLDTYGELESLTDRVRVLGSDPENGAVVVFSSRTTQRLSEMHWPPERQHSSPRRLTANRSLRGSTAAGGKHVVLTQRSQHAQLDEALRWPGSDIGLTERESELLSLLPTGLTNSELGRRVYVSENTIKTHLRHLYASCGVRNRAQAAAFAGQGMLEIRFRERSPSIDHWRRGCSHGVHVGDSMTRAV